MGTAQKILTTVLWGLLVLIMISVIGAGLWRNDRDARATGAAPADPDAAAAVVHVLPAGDGAAAEADVPLGWDVPDFALIDQDERPVTREDLRGRPWVAAFMFTRCPTGVCPAMAGKLAKLQDAIDPRVKLVSFSIDPERDTPAVLRAYAASFQADPDRWSLLTGDRATIYGVADAMKVGVKPNPTPEQPDDITHSDRFVLVGPDMRVVRTYRSADDDALERLAADAAKLAAGTP